MNVKFLTIATQAFKLAYTVYQLLEKLILLM